MAKLKISDFDTNPDNNTDINSINIAEGCAPSGINNAIRQLMSDLKEFQTGAGGDPFNGAVNGTVGATTPNTGAFTTLSASGAFSANGGATLGNATGDALTINSSAVSIPNGLNFGSDNLVLSGGNVGVGTAGGFGKVDIQRFASTPYTTLTIGDFTTSTNPIGIYFRNTGTSPAGISTAGSPLAFYLAAGSSEAIRIDSSGNVGIGTSSPSSFNSSANRLVIGTGTGNSGATIYTGTSSQASIYFADGTAGSAPYSGQFIYDHSDNSFLTYVNGTTLATKIDSFGNLLVGTTTASPVTSSGFKFLKNYESAGNDRTSIVFPSSSGGVPFTLYSTGAAAYRFYIDSAGTISATNTTISSLSDQRLKENIRDLDDGLEKVLALQPRKFDWKEGKGANIKNARGFIAQEFEVVFPDMIDKWLTPAPEGEEPYKAVNANLIPTIVKAIQEQQAIIADLKSRIETLENK